ncbi:hypothetical protein [Flavobacterium restrictum]|uniref:Uncharacterized protein n=1 Tax=Flavobacterium restrictum TaxID=2594428 RepID=A0A553EEA8_9FLAO|nr:hypothetical protein [Flavobacterium restrictum]TRX43133.1 hypothetical protein FNW21_02005 [Flavobacterium restrictum]
MKNTEKFPKAPNEQLEDQDGYPKYPENEDIYNKFDKEFDIDPENISINKESIKIQKNPTWNEKNFDQDQSGDDLDIPGTELDDDQENIGSEDEENNSYSIGGDDHNDLDEDNQ